MVVYLAIVTAEAHYFLEVASRYQRVQAGMIALLLPKAEIYTTSQVGRTAEEKSASHG